MISETTFSHYNLKILRPKVTKNLKNLRNKFCESAPIDLNKPNFAMVVRFGSSQLYEMTEQSLKVVAHMKSVQK